MIHKSTILRPKWMLIIRNHISKVGGIFFCIYDWDRTWWWMIVCLGKWRRIWKIESVMIILTPSFEFGHTEQKAPDPIRTLKLSCSRPSQYCGGRPRGNTGCRILLQFLSLPFFLFFTLPFSFCLIFCLHLPFHFHFFHSLACVLFYFYFTKPPPRLFIRFSFSFSISL